MIFLWILLILYTLVGAIVAHVIADMNHHKRPSPSEWLIGLFWLPAILALATAHWWYKAS